MSLPTFQDFAPPLDFSQWETAIQNFFCDNVQGGGMFTKPPDNDVKTRETWDPGGLFPFFTGFQAQVFQKQRPRIELAPVNQNEIQETRIMDASGRLRRNAWRVALEFFVITKADYAAHADALAKIRSIIHMMNPSALDPATGNWSQDAIQTTGLNAFLITHLLSKIVDAGGPTFGGHLDIDKGYYVTPLKYNAVFAVNPSKWPGGTINA